MWLIKNKISILVLLGFLLFLPTQYSVAFPSFEIYSQTCGVGKNCTAYPKVENASAVVEGGYLIVKAKVFDVSGVNSVAVIINDSQGSFFDSLVMYDDGGHQDGLANDDIYGAVVDISNYPGGQYTGGISPIDSFGNGGLYSGAGNFSVANPVSIELWTDKQEGGWQPDSRQDFYNTYWENSRDQFIVLASELSDSGLVAGSNIQGISLKTKEAPDYELGNLRVRAKLTSSNIVTSWEGGWVDLFGPETIATSDLDVSTPGNWKAFVFNQNFQWDGVSNIMFDISRSSSWWRYNGAIWVRNNVGEQRMFAGANDYLNVNLVQGYDYGQNYNFCPSLKINYLNP